MLTTQATLMKVKNKPWQKTLAEKRYFPDNLNTLTIFDLHQSK